MRVVGDGGLGRALALDDDLLVEADSLDALALLPEASVQMAYADPPWNTGAARRHTRLSVAADAEGARAGFAGRRYAVREVGRSSYPDAFDDHVGFLERRLREVHRVLDRSGTLYLHVEPRVSHHCRLLLDRIFGPECFLNEIVWAYDFGARSRRRWPAKHDTILVYVKDPRSYWFDSEAVDREPYMAPGLQTAERAARGKLPTSVWWHTIVPTNGAERTGYPTQKPEGIVRRMVAASSRPGDLCLDPFAGSGTLGAVCAKLGRRFVLIDESAAAVEVCRQRLEPLLARRAG